MNANASDIDNVTADAIAGAKALYGVLTPASLFDSTLDIGLKRLVPPMRRTMIFGRHGMDLSPAARLALSDPSSGRSIYWWDPQNDWQYTSLTTFPYL